MSDRLMMASGVAFLLIGLLSFIVWRIWYYAPLKVRQRNQRKDQARYLATPNKRDAAESP